MNLKEVSSNPLLLLVIGGIITGLLIPYITNQWQIVQQQQNHQRELEIKTGLVSDISDAVMSLLTMTELTKTIVSTPYEEFYGEYKLWQSASGVIESKLWAYFYDSSLPQLWSNYSEILRDFNFLSVSNDICSRAKYINEIRDYLSIELEPMNNTGVDNCAMSNNGVTKIYKSPFTSNFDRIDWSDLVKNGNQTELSDSWELLKQGLIYQKDRINQEILNSHIQAFT